MSGRRADISGADNRNLISRTHVLIPFGERLR